MLLSLVKRAHPAHLIFPHRTAAPHALRPLTKKPRLHDPCSNEASRSGTWNSLPPSRGCTGRNSRRKKNSHTPHARRSSVQQKIVPSVQADIEHRIATLCAGAMQLLPTPQQTGTRPADHKQPIRSVVLSLPHTEEAGLPRPPPEPPPGVSTAPPRRTTSSGSTSPCPSCSSVFSSVHKFKAHARRTNPGTPIVAEGLTCGFCGSSTVSPTSASRAGHHRKCQAYQRAKNGQRTSAGSNDSRSPSATPLLQSPPAAEPRQSTGDRAAHAVGMPPSSATEHPTLWEHLSHDSTRSRRKNWPH
ncbi:hypothetical protein TcCL_NonESM10807, partial [Trypanosoma cruzi]